MSLYYLNKLNRYSNLDNTNLVIIESTVSNIELPHQISLGNLLINIFSLKNEDRADIKKKKE